MVKNIKSIEDLHDSKKIAALKKDMVNMNEMAGSDTIFKLSGVS